LNSEKHVPAGALSAGYLSDGMILTSYP
jgi:hypothetical protein